jgi:glyoxylase-like metal-dependent hydrolase (beta-lactamase superfamily II)
MPELKIKVYNPGQDGIFQVASCVIYGEKEAVLVDAQFQKKYALDLVNIIKGTKRELKYIFVSHWDPDYYFGVCEVMKAFKKAKVISTAQTAYMIEATYQQKLEVWKDSLGEDAPEKIIIPEAVKDRLELEGQEILIETQPSDPGHSFLYIPSLKTILGGASVTEGSHLWLADTQTKEEIEHWIWQLDSIGALSPSKVIPSHFINSDFSPALVDRLRQYLLNYLGATRRYSSSGDIVNAIKQAFPNLPKENELVLGAKVYTHEMEWPIKECYPAICRKIRMDFGEIKADFDFLDNKKLSFVGLEGIYKGKGECVDYKANEITKGIYMVYWEEKVNNNQVVQIEDFNTMNVYTNVISSCSQALHLKGKMNFE